MTGKLMKVVEKEFEGRIGPALRKLIKEQLARAGFVQASRKTVAAVVAEALELARAAADENDDDYAAMADELIDYVGGWLVEATVDAVLELCDEFMDGTDEELGLAEEVGDILRGWA